MRLGLSRLVGLALVPLAIAQSSTSNSSAAASSTSKHAAALVTTTLTSFVSSGTAAQPTTLTLTLSLNSTADAQHATATDNATVASNSTAAGTNATLNGTSNATAWNATDDWLPFTVRLDPAYGVAGGLLITSGLPVAVLGGKNRWSSLAIAAGYTFALFTLVLILSLGVEPDMQPPSPTTPSSAMRGLYLLACAIACAVGAGLGVFFFNAAKYWVGAVGGFAFGWFLLATRAGGLVTSIAARWGLLGGLTVASLLATMVPAVHPYGVLVSTAWTGATTFTLGVDCFTRAGLKEFFMYNLGYRDLFPDLDGAKFPLTQTMQVELGVIAAVAIIGAAVQFRVVNVLHRRLKQMREEEEARIESEQIALAAERFKNHGADLDEWEAKHGKGAGSVTAASAGATTLNGTPGSKAERASMLVPSLGYEHRAPSPLSLRGNRAEYESVPRESDSPTSAASPTSATPALPPPARSRSTLFDDLGLKAADAEGASPCLPRSPTSPTSPADPNLASQMRLLDEVRRTRAEIRASMDQLRSAANTPTDAASSHHRLSSSSARLLDERPASAAGAGASHRHSSVSVLNRQRFSSISSLTPPLDTCRLSTASSHVLGAGADGRRLSTSSSRVLGDAGHRPAEQLTQHRGLSAPSIVDPEPPRSEWDAFLAEREVLRPAPAPVADRRARDARDRPASVLERRSTDFGAALPPRGTQSRTVPTRPSSYYDTPSAPAITGSAARPGASAHRSSQQFPRTMTYDELAHRHRKRILRLQEPVTAQVREREDVARAKDTWEARQRAERAEMDRRERERGGATTAATKDSDAAAAGARVPRTDRMKSTDEWRRSVNGLDQVARAPRQDGHASKQDKRRSQAWAA